MPGWKEQWYGKDPAAVMAIGALVAPRVKVPVLNRPALSVAVWTSVSLFVQATVCPTRNVAPAGEKDMPPWLPRMEMATSAVAAGGAGVVVVVGVAGAAGGVPPPPLGPGAARVRTTRGSRRRRNGSPGNRRPQTPRDVGE